MLLSIFDSPLPDYKTVKNRMNFEGLSKLTQFPYATALKLGE
jgi:hypothetical protein